MNNSSLPFRKRIVEVFNIREGSLEPSPIQCQLFDEDIKVGSQDYWNIGSQ
jgi:hypothetical protein